MSLSRMVLCGFKSIRDCDLTLNNGLNVLIGANGAGKSNFISFFKMIRELLEGRLQHYISKNGGPDSVLYFGRKVTKQISTELYFGNNGYKFVLEPTNDNRMMFSKECLWWNMRGDWDENSGHFETKFHKNIGTSQAIYSYTIPKMKRWVVYHFHDTGESSPIKQRHGLNDNVYFREDASNLAAFLYLLKNNYSREYQQIIKTIRLVAPFFKDFFLRPQPDNKDQIELEWMERNSDVPFKAHLFSDGTLRFICLTTVLLQPQDLRPDTILIDEPELGLHPAAIHTLGALIRTVAQSCQIILSTQSTDLLDEFEAGNIIVADRDKGWTNLHHLAPEALAEWLDEYSIGELWHKNILGGRPAR